jgi:hypothetical protein
MSIFGMPRGLFFPSRRGAGNYTRSMIVAVPMPGADTGRYSHLDGP